MNSNILAGERRWASARRGGMTVLGKVSVPKPINLPSQRLEHHGLDPNVEIVPKGTVGWGSRTSYSGSNPLTTSSLSPNADVGTVSPSNLSGRPSSGGSGTRPSTSGSDRTHDPVPNAWGSNSRPSSASGTLSSNQTSSASLRPRSAENRPNSSQLSRFADPMSKSSAVWGSSVTAERLGVKSSKEDGFSLSSGDFPTLGSEKDNSEKNVEPEDHSLPSSASGRIVQAKEDGRPQADVNHGTVNSWKADGPQSAEDDIYPVMEKWQEDPHQCFNANTGPYFDAWRGRPMNGPAGGWYGGRPRGPAFGAHVGPGGFPMEPFPYYRPQIPPPHLAGSQPVPRQGPRGPHPRTGDLYRPQMPDAYARPGVPFRPGFYPGPHGPLPFEGYYGPPLGYCKSDRDIPYMGMAAGPPVYNGYPAPVPDINNSHCRAAGRGPTGKTMSEQVEADHSEDTHGPKGNPPNRHDEIYQREEGVNREQNMQPNVPHPGKTHLPVSSRKNEWGAEEDAEEPIYTDRMAPSENSSHSYKDRVHSADSVKVKSFDGTDNVKGSNDNWSMKSESMPSFPPAVPLPHIASHRDSSLPAANKNSALMHKIDGLNAKFRVSDGRKGPPSAYNKEEERNGLQTVDMKISDYTGDVSNTAGSFERTPVSRDFVSVPDEVIVPIDDNPMHPIAGLSRRSYHGGHSRVDHRGKGKFNSQDADGWPRKLLNTESSSAVTASNNECAPNARAQGPNIVVEDSESSEIDPMGKLEGNIVETYDSTDIQAQRAKMRELAKQRTLQLQKEEEERIKEQRAKAFAKLEELNRRTLAVEAANRKAESTQVIADILAEPKESHTVGGHVIAELNWHEPGFNLVSNHAVAAVNRDTITYQAGESVEVSRDFHLEMQQKDLLESNISPLPMDEDSRDGSNTKVVSQFSDGGMSRHKQMGYKHKQNNSSRKSLTEKSVPSAASEAQKNHTHLATTDITSEEGPKERFDESNMPKASNTVVEPSARQKRKIGRYNKTKPKMDETPAEPALQPVISNANHGNESIDNTGSNDTLSNLDISVSAVTGPDRGVQARSFTNEEPQSRGSNQWKPHHARRLPRSQQAHRFTEKLHGSDTVVWAPVNRAKGSDEVSQNSGQESANSTKCDNVAQSSLKGKRAEMERYVPKPVAKELAQQGCFPPLSFSVGLSRSNEDAESEQSGSGSSASQQPGSSATAHVRSDIENDKGDGSHNFQKKDNGAWSQRGSADSYHMKGVHIAPSPTSEPTKDLMQSKDLVQSARSEIDATNAETKVPYLVSTSDGGNMPTNIAPAAVSKYHSVKDQAAGGGKRHPPRKPRNSGNNTTSMNTYSCETDGNSIKSAAADMNQTDRTLGSKENRSFGERTSSHWQPKSSLNSANNQHGNRTTGSESVIAESNSLPKKDHPEVQVVPRQDKETGNVSPPQPGQSVRVKSNVSEDSFPDHLQLFDREQKPVSVKGRPYFTNQHPVGSGESPPTANTVDQLEHNIPSGSRRTGRQNIHSFRGHDPRGDWSSGHDNRPHNVPASRERQRQNVHCEYQPAGPFKGNNKPEKAEGPADGGTDIMDQRQRERGQSHSKRGGNFRRR